MHEIYGHKFIMQQFYQIMRCALCGELLKNAAGYQCEDCKYTCHKKCYSKVVTKCISKTNAETVFRPPLRLPVSHKNTLCANHVDRRIPTRRNSIIESPIVSNHSPISVRIGVVIVAISFPSVKNMPGNVQVSYPTQDGV